MSQQRFFFSTNQALKRGYRIAAECKIRSLNPILDIYGIISSCERIKFAPDNLEVEKFPIILDAKDKIARVYIEHADNICVHQGTERVKAFVQQRYHIIVLIKTFLGTKFRCFLCRRFAAQKIQPVMTPLPACRFLTDSAKYPLVKKVDFFGLFYIEDAKGQNEKHNGLILTCLFTWCVHLEACPDLDTDIFLNAYRRFVSRRCQPTTMLSDNGKTFIGASDELKKCVNCINKNKIYKAMAATNRTWKFNPPCGHHFGGIWSAWSRPRNALFTIDAFRLQKNVACCVQDNFGRYWTSKH